MTAAIVGARTAMQLKSVLGVEELTLPPLIGTLAAFAASRLLAKMLYGVKPNDPATYAAVVVVLGTIALLACYLPARRAMRVDPVNALKQD